MWTVCLPVTDDVGAGGGGRECLLLALPRLPPAPFLLAGSGKTQERPHVQVWGRRGEHPVTGGNQEADVRLSHGAGLTLHPLAPAPLSTSVAPLPAWLRVNCDPPLRLRRKLDSGL